MGSSTCLSGDVKPVTSKCLGICERGFVVKASHSLGCHHLTDHNGRAGDDVAERICPVAHLASSNQRVLGPAESRRL